MPSIEPVSKLLIMCGVFLALFGLLLVFWPRFPLIGRLPSDIFIQKGGICFFFPILTCLTLRAGFTILVNFMSTPFCRKKIEVGMEHGKGLVRSNHKSGEAFHNEG